MLNRLDGIITTLEELGSISTGELIENLKATRSDIAAFKSEAQFRVEALERKVGQVEGERASLKSRLDGFTNTEHLKVYVEDWCSMNNCDPNDIDSLMSTVESELDDLLESLAEKDPEEWGKERDWTVEVTVELSGSVSVRAKSMEDAAEQAYNDVDDGTVELSDLSVDRIEVGDCEED